VVAGLLASLVLAAPASAGFGPSEGTFVEGAAGLGDPFFPQAGNGGYNVHHYELGLDYDPKTDRLEGTTYIIARATQSLRSFHLDLRGFDISKLEVEGRAAEYTRAGQELTVTPKRGLHNRQYFVVRVDYAGVPEPVIDPDGSSEGWLHTDDGAFVVGEPQGSPGWFPANDNPRDKATYVSSITVPKGNVALGNGVLHGKRTSKGKTTWRWVQSDPMATYLATATNGDFVLDVSRTRAGLLIYNAVDPQQAEGTAEVLAKQPAMIRYFSDTFGRYPFDAAGAIVDDAPDVGYALESQTKPNYDRAPDESTVAHEIAHQWFGNSVSLTVWPDIWLNEGFAAFSEWLWDEHTGGPTTRETFQRIYDNTSPTSSIWTTAPRALPGPEELFASTAYTRGALTLAALQEKIGDRDFFRLLRRWYRENRDGNVTTEDFIALSERVTGEQLDEFFDVWLYRSGRPTGW